ncbi:hypothetical protein GLYMA_09G161500v4 [Glycine max]|uniref:Uncharacterized protein n=1 Tax=Glycine max TaxID=3847 RepID=K7LE89_SOYBN|nr:hypothetical protein GYH30_025219 [Glycine max]KRH38839.1 hypothetical protein GLYMA_09G161500v4 [Glycine max]
MSPHLATPLVVYKLILSHGRSLIHFTSLILLVFFFFKCLFKSLSKLSCLAKMARNYILVCSHSFYDAPFLFCPP